MARKPIEVEARTKAFALTYGWGPVKGAHPYIGAHYFLRAPASHTTPMSVALFATRREAEKAWKIALKKNPDAKIVLVDVFVKRAAKQKTTP